MSNLVSIDSLKKPSLISSESKVFTIPDSDHKITNCYTLNVKELLQLSVPHNFCSNYGNNLILRVQSSSITFALYNSESDSTQVTNIIRYNNSNTEVTYDIATGCTFNSFDSNDDIKEIQIISSDDTDLVIYSGTIYGIDTSGCPNLKSITFNSGTLNANILDVSWNQASASEIISGLDQSKTQTDINWNCNYIIDTVNTDSVIKTNILNRKKIS